MPASDRPASERPLSELIDLEIAAGGPISLAHYMGLCLTHPQKGYYRKADPLGQGGDFVTAPEISQIFGELIGAFLADLYLQMGSPPKLSLLELGPGRGTLMADALRVAARAPGLLDALDLYLLETNPALVALQNERLAPFSPRWVDEPEDIASPAPLLVLANEFFDALPVRQFVRRGGNWYERCVGLAAGRRVFGLSPTPYDPALLPPAFACAEEGAVAEIGLAAAAFMTRLARLVAPRGGAILVIDYGYPETGPGETLQAVSRHRFADPLERPGEIDLSTHVDFQALGAAARMAGLTVHPLATQGEFLRGLGFTSRHDSLLAANPDRHAALGAARRRLLDRAAMGTLFKVFCAASPGLNPAGLPSR